MPPQVVMTEGIRPRPGGTHPARRSRRGGRGRWLAALVIFAGLYLLFQVPGSGEAQRVVRQYLTSSETDWAPALGKLVGDGIWLEPIERWVLAEDGALPRSAVGVTAVARGSWQLPVSGRVVHTFGQEVSPVDKQPRQYPGIDVEAPAYSLVRAAQAGTVTKVSQNMELGRFVELSHPEALNSVYAGVSEILVTEGQEVTAGQVIARLGDGDGSLPVMRFEVLLRGEPVDPSFFLTAPGGA